MLTGLILRLLQDFFAVEAPSFLQVIILLAIEEAVFVSFLYYYVAKKDFKLHNKKAVLWSTTLVIFSLFLFIRIYSSLIPTTLANALIRVFVIVRPMLYHAGLVFFLYQLSKKVLNTCLSRGDSHDA